MLSRKKRDNSLLSLDDRASKNFPLIMFFYKTNFWHAITRHLSIDQVKELDRGTHGLETHGFIKNIWIFDTMKFVYTSMLSILMMMYVKSMIQEINSSTRNNRSVLIS